MRHRLFLSILMILASSLVLLVVLDGLAARPAQTRSENRRIVRALRLTDLALSTEARYTRHPSQADLFSAFQDGPASLEHFPSGSWGPPPHLLKPPGRGAAHP